MVDEAETGNDNTSIGGNANMARDVAERAVLSIARLIGRQVARQHFEESQAANDNEVHPPKNARLDREDGDDGGL
ncbi:MAG: hypothetical protein E5W83_30375 [Mesorhizobium sp.]|nr:MAG: hypothetical protein E5W83_30375 [Mesorhizobium sp.]